MVYSGEVNTFAGLALFNYWESLSDPLNRRRRVEFGLETDGFTETSESNVAAVVQSVKSQWDTPYNGLYGEPPPERGTLFKLQVFKRVFKYKISNIDAPYGCIRLFIKHTMKMRTGLPKVGM